MGITVTPSVFDVTATSSPVAVTVTGENGAAGQDGQGVPAGGSSGEVLTKQSGTDYDTDWQPASGGDAPWSYDFDARHPAYANTNMNTFVVISGSPFAYQSARLLDSSVSPGSVSYKVPLTAGTYDFHVVFYRETYMANMSCTVDGTTVGTWATQGSPGGPALLTISDVAIATSGTKTVAVVKTATNSDLVYLYALLIRRTA